MAYEIPGFSLTLVAKEAIAQHRFVEVTVTTGTTGYVATAGDPAIGVSQGTPAIGEACTIVTSGVVMVECGTVAMTVGMNVQSHTDGTALVAASGDAVLGVVLEGGAAGEYLTVLLTPGFAVLA